MTEDPKRKPTITAEHSHAFNMIRLTGQLEEKEEEKINSMRLAAQETYVEFGKEALETMGQEFRDLLPNDLSELDKEHQRYVDHAKTR
jgi:rubrerythrin